MTREEAMSYIIPAIERTWNDKICKQIKDVLSKQPSEWERDHEILKAYADGQESMKPCEDAISRKAALECCRNEWEEEVEERLRALPPAKPQEKTGRWITTRTFMHDGEYYCNKCKCDAPNNEKWDYCPICGARMNEPQESEE